MASNRLAPEWEQQDAVILIWPHSNSDWIGQLSSIEKTYIELSRYISRNQKLILIAYNENHHHHIENILSKHNIQQENIILLDIATDDTWVRDFGPIYVMSNSALVIFNFTFNAWGEKYTYDHDNAFNKLYKEKIINSVTINDIDFILEGGNLEVNNQSLLMCSSSCFKRKNNKNNLNIKSIQTDFHKWFGCDNILWIDDVILAGDDTDGHIDTLVRFCKDDVIVYSAPGHHADPNNECLLSLDRQVKMLRKNESSIGEIIPLPCPQPIFHDGNQLPATYANFLITNKYVFVPVFNDKQDISALKIMEQLFPSREIIDIESNALIQQYGGIHCATMQIPQGSLAVD